MADSAMATSAPEAAPRRRRHWGRRFFLLTLLLGATGYFLPQIASAILASPAVMAYVSTLLPAQLDVRKADLSWQGPVQLQNVTVTTPEGVPVATVDNVTSQQSLWDLLVRPADPVRLNLDGFRLRLRIPAGVKGEVELDLARLAERVQRAKFLRPGTPLVVNITNGAVELVDADRELLTVWEPLNVTYEFSAGDVPTQTVSLALGESPGDPESLQLTGQWKQLQADPVREEVTLQTNGRDVSLTPFKPLLAAVLDSGSLPDQVSLDGTAAFRRDADAGWSAQLSVALDDGAVLPVVRNDDSATSPVSLVREKSDSGLSFDLETFYERAADQLLVPKLRLVADDNVVDLTGQVAQLSGDGRFDLSGLVRSPAIAADQVLPEAIRNEVQIKGLKLSNMTFRGVLTPRDPAAGNSLECMVDASWDEIQAYGLTLSAGTLHCVLAGQKLTATPQDVLINGGKLHRLPVVLLNPAAPELVFEDGLMLEDVALTEKVCRKWLRYISPTLANATATEGRLTLTMSAGRVPLKDLNTADLPGVLRIQQARVKPGPLAMQVLGQVNQVQQLVTGGAGTDFSNQTWMRINDEQVRFRLVDGRVHHEQFRCEMGDVPVSTSGSMGLDNTLAMQLRIGLPDRLTANRGPVLRSLQGEAIVLGISGTADQPEIDARAMAEFGKRIGVKAGLGLLERILEKREERNR